ncbi:hypothetical protein N7519_008074 [Penicillium mononematosum]|uniref:uncharacterized protein n=1 Tax=Penicillium mononematosum TaxID=268346 RepID=UPI00254779F4|nr:uncharacterized protein N7519_008074 [Penicillium mononematosum]KAJ6186773.1 hypothetical protein N7519_008074 [Penicillium mononematosum]
MARLTRPFRESIRIELCGYGTGRRFYSTGEHLEGYVWIKTKDVIQPSMVEILFRGQSRIESDGVMLPVKTYRKKTFLELTQPIEDGAFSTCQNLKTGYLYKIPFFFVIPTELPISICRHGEDWEALQSHLLPPPSLGYASTLKENHSKLEDLSTTRFGIGYSIQARLSKKTEEDKEPCQPGKSAELAIRILPGVKERSRVNTFDDPPPYTKELQTSKTICNHDTKGTLYVGALEPQPIHLNAVHHDEIKCSTTVLEIALWFVSVNSEPPPLRSVSKKVVAHTTARICQSEEVAHSSVVQLGDLDFSSVRWKECPLTDYFANISNEERSEVHTHTPKRLYRASVVVPISLPTSKTFVPTFESCLLSRSYVLGVTLLFGSIGKALKFPSVKLKVPLRIAGLGG